MDAVSCVTTERLPICEVSGNRLWQPSKQKGYNGSVATGFECIVQMQHGFQSFNREDFLVATGFECIVQMQLFSGQRLPLPNGVATGFECIVQMQL